MKEVKKKVDKLAGKIKNSIKKSYSSNVKSLKSRIKTLSKNQSLEFIAINRKITPGHVTKIASSIDLIGVVRSVIVATVSFITGKPIKIIVDGQHLFLAMIRCNVPVEYVEIEIRDMEHLVEVLAKLNASSKSWSMHDYMHVWSSLSEDYTKLIKYCNIYDFEASFTASILSGRGVYRGEGGSGITNALKKGKFKIVDEKFQVSILDDLTDVLKVIPRMDRKKNKYVCAEYVSFKRNCTEKYNHNIFIKNLAKNKDKFVLATQEQEQLADMFRVLAK
jgi:hypothetical protein